ncbi:MAG: hypothetical protein JWO38_3133 [Gemmataceae bacterium]|nr:hypothetical protein [Gemmataceae bacterium]
MHGSALASTTLRRRVALVVAAALLAAGPGCTRKFFRQRADDDVTGLLTQKNVFTDWQIKNWHVYPDPRSRFAEPCRPDRPPYPPDDYAARVLAPSSQWPGKRAGVGRYEGSGYLDYLAGWDAQNRAEDRGDMPDPIPKKGGAGPRDGKEAGPPVEKLPPPKPAPPAPPGTGQIPPDGPLAPVGPPPRTAAALVGPPAPLPPPTLTETRQNQVIVAAGEVPDGDKVVPVVMLIPAVQPPAELPKPDPAAPPEAAQKKPEPGPFPAGPGVPPGGPAIPGQGGAYAVVATGAAATDFLNALISDQTGYRVTMDQAVELGIWNSREFQNQREALYLAALPVTLARFNLASQAFFTETAVLDFPGRLLGRTSTATFTTTPSLIKLFPTGALLAVQLANQVVVDLANGRPTVTLSNLTVNLSQPFLRGGGYSVTLEPLTFAERNLVYAIRSYARFRKIFYVAIAAGGTYTNNPYGLPGLSQNLGRGVGINFTAPDTGYLPCLLAAAVLANQRRNIDYLENLLRLYQAFREGGQQSDLQVAQVESQLVISRGQLLGSTVPNTAGGVNNVGVGNGIRAFLDAIDSFKLQLGVPITTGVDLDQSPLRPIRRQLDRFEAVYAQARDVETSARRFNPADPVDQFRARWRQLLTDSPLVRGTGFAKEIPARWGAWEKLTRDQLIKRLADLGEERRKLLDRRADRQLKGQPEPDAEVRRLNEIEADTDLGVFEQALRVYEAQPWVKEMGAVRNTVQAAAFRDVFNAFYQLIIEGRNERLAQIRQQWPKLSPCLVDGVDITDVPLDDAYTAAVQAALTHRLDLMSARGQVVDAWRQIKVTANALQGVFTVQYNLTSTTPPGGANPFAFSGNLTDHQVVFQGQLPLVRRAERNAYRTALINYQASRRTLQAYEDNIANDVRADIRGLRTLNELYRVQQRLIELGYYQVDNAQALLLAPPALAGPGQAAANDAASQAALTQQVLAAQSSLVTAQNTLYTIWVNYVIARMNFFTDTDLMQLDERGIWRDEYDPGNEEPAGPGPNPSGPRGERLPPPRPAGEPGRGR